jgi:hypothetical protein
MKRRWFVIACMLGLLGGRNSPTRAIDTPDLPDASVPISGAFVVPSGTGIRILSHRGEWSAMFGTGGSSDPFFLVAGEYENTSGKPLTYVKFQFELLNDAGVVVTRDYGYNRKAEALREEDYESGKKSLPEMKIEKVSAGKKDGFRFFFFKVDTPAFRSYRIRVLESR